MYKSLIFDIDGTLLDTKQALFLALQQTVLDVQGRHVTSDEVSFFFGLPGVQTLTRLGFENPQAGVQNWIRNVSKFHHEMRIYPEIRMVMDTLRHTPTSLGAVTSKLRNELDADFTKFDLFRYFDFIVCASDTQLHKPHPEPMLKYLEISQTNPMHAIYIGDTQYDMECAFGAGISFALASWGNANIPEEIKKQATVILHKPTDILGLIQ